MLSTNQNILTSVQQFIATRLSKIVIAAVLGVAIIGAAFGTTITTSQNAHAESIQSIINQVFGADAPSATRIAMCESTMNPNAVNSTPILGSHAQGLFQILYPSTWKTTSQAGASPFNAYANAVAAHEIFVRDGHSWREWECQP